MRLMKGKYSIVIVAILLVNHSCRPGQVSKEKLLRIIDKDEQLTQTQEVNGIKVQAKYVPNQLLALQELSGMGKWNKEKLEEVERKYCTQYYFRLSFSKNDKEVIRELGSYDRYSDMVQVFSFEMGGHINASTENNDTLYLKNYAFDQDYGMSSANSCLLAFGKSDFERARQIRVNIGEFGLGIGSLRFVFDKDRLQDLPMLDFEMTK
jgi:hypothetical protein